MLFISQKVIGQFFPYWLKSFPLNSSIDPCKKIIQCDESSCRNGASKFKVGYIYLIAIPISDNYKVLESMHKLSSKFTDY